MWEWKPEFFASRDLATDPILAALGARFDGSALPPNVTEALLGPLRMRALPLVEWDCGYITKQIFAFLRSEGSKRGFFLDHPVPGGTGDRFYECELSEHTAAEVEDQNLLAYQHVFIDDRYQLAIVSWYSDMTYLCMQPALFDRYLAQHPTDFSMDGEGPLASTFDDALAAAFRRADSWGQSDRWREDMARLTASLAWQLPGDAQPGRV